MKTIVINTDNNYSIARIVVSLIPNWLINDILHRVFIMDIYICVYMYMKMTLHVIVITL